MYHSSHSRDADIAPQIVEALQSGGYKGRIRGGRVERIVCPDCSEPEMWTRVERPFVLFCGRLSKCGVQIHAQDLFPDLFQSWSDRFPPTPTNPNASADAYLESQRGFDLKKINGWYSQESFLEPKTREASATVRFRLADGVYWERLIDRAHRFGKRKAHVRGSYQGLWWQPPATELTTAPRIFITEGVFDAISLLHHGEIAVSAMSSGHYPEHALASLATACAAANLPRPRLIFSYDTDNAGRAGMKKAVSRARDDGWTAEAAIPTGKGRAKPDWNELHRTDRITTDAIEEALHQGALLTAVSAYQRGLLMLRRGRDGESFPLEFNNRLYWFEGVKKGDDEKTAIDPELDDPTAPLNVEDKYSIRCTCICECLPRALYYQANRQTDESWYYFDISFPHDGKAIKNTFTSSQLTTASEFKKRLFAIAPGGMFIGSTPQLDRYIRGQTYNIKTVETLDYIGYSKEHSAYVLGDIAIQNGKVIPINDEDFFELDKVSLKTLSSQGLHINTTEKDYTEAWVNNLWKAYGPKGFTALAYWLGTLFAEQIRAEQKSYPFLEIVGEPGTGKSTLIEFLWKLLGRPDYEGFDPSKSSLAARARNFAQVSNLPVVLIEGDRNDPGAKQKSFDWDELKTAYNGRSVRARGVRNGGNETYEPPFRGAVVISQNSDVQASEAVLQRIVHIKFLKSDHGTGTKEAAQALERIPTEQVSGFALRACAREAEIVKLVTERLPDYERALHSPEVRLARILKNHGQIMALVDALALVLPISDSQISATQDYVALMAAERQKAIAADHPLVQEFWDLFDFIQSDPGLPDLNHATNTSEHIAINLPQFEAACAQKHLRLPPMTELKRALRESRTHRFIESKAVNSRTNRLWNETHSDPETHRPITVKCWVFEAKPATGAADGYRPRASRTTTTEDET